MQSYEAADTVRLILREFDVTVDSVRQVTPDLVPLFTWLDDHLAAMDPTIDVNAERDRKTALVASALSASQQCSIARDTATQRRSDASAAVHAVMVARVRLGVPLDGLWPGGDAEWMASLTPAAASLMELKLRGELALSSSSCSRAESSSVGTVDSVSRGTPYGPMSASASPHATSPMVPHFG